MAIIDAPRMIRRSLSYSDGQITRLATTVSSSIVMNSPLSRPRLLKDENNACRRKPLAVASRHSFHTGGDVLRAEYVTQERDRPGS